jgi:YHS domain-containing protein
MNFYDFDDEKVEKTVKDVVCGMEIAKKSAKAKSEYKGNTYYFCALGCKKAFEANPGKYIVPDQGMS